MGDYLVRSNSPKARERKEAIYRKTHPLFVKEQHQISLESERLINRYKSCLSDISICKARSLFWCADTVEEYFRMFFRNVLVESYNVWDESHKNYANILKILKKKDPRWTDAFVAEHERKIKLCKRPIYDCEVVPLK